jgi:arabinoxylan arabinofuranohydrolase
MKKTGVVFFPILCFFAMCFADNPAIQTCYTADPAPMVYNGKVYIYVGCDSSAAPSTTYLMRYWKCYSSSDMVNWTDHGPVLFSNQFKWGGSDANAAQCVYRDGKFYYYVSIGGTDGIAIGIAVATNPLGPFTDIGQPILTAAQMSGCDATHGWRGLDPTAFVDTDGMAYLYTGNNALYWVTLNNNMTSFSGTVSCLAANNTASFGPDYEEAPWFYKRNDTYYLVYASQFPECIRYSTSSNPLGPWTYKGQIMASQPNGVSNTIHPGVCDFGGNSYFFYHNAGLSGGGSYKRSVCIEQFKYNADGTIPTIKETAGGVVSGVGNLNPYDTTQAETICWESGVRTEACAEGGIDVDSIHNGDNIKVEGVDFSTGATSFVARVASATSGGNIEIRLDSLTGTLIGTCAVSNTGSWQTWATKTCTVSGATGIHNLYFKFTGSSGLLFNFNWWKFDKDPVSTSKRLNIIDCNNSVQTSYNSDKYEFQLDFSNSLQNDKVYVGLFDIQGRLISTLFSGKLTSCQFSVYHYKLQAGTYLLKISTEYNENLLSRSVVIY